MPSPLLLLQAGKKIGLPEQGTSFSKQERRRACLSQEQAPANIQIQTDTPPCYSILGVIASVAGPAADLRLDELAWKELQRSIRNHVHTSPDSTSWPGQTITSEACDCDTVSGLRSCRGRGTACYRQCWSLAHWNSGTSTSRGYWLYSLKP